MEISSGIQASLSGRYALALFDLARESKAVDAVSKSLATVKAALAESADLRLLTASPAVSRDDAARAIAAVAKSLDLDELTVRFLGVLATNGRLAALKNVIRDFAALATAHRGETTAAVTSAHALDDEQVAALKQQLRTRFGREVAVDLTVDPAILGGLIVKVGSQQIDSSIRTKLNALAHAMKG
ncbi:F0F1 ATP synthase subunit delta [Sphingomonas sp. ID0503]|uniref:F0F1 ATP synthase subunit delta n=1 Tax=Sphingomonas sp. ID0503 TaxID=3399691 RepID=UPI003AFB0B9E